MLAGAALAPAANAANAAPVGPKHARRVVARPGVNPATSTYVVAAYSAGTSRLLLVDRATGAVRRTLTTAPDLGTDQMPISPFTEATVAPDGTVWVVRSGPGPSDSVLLRITGSQVQVHARYVTHVSVSPDGTRIVYATVAPDLDHDGYGTDDLRVESLSSGARSVLASVPLPVGPGGTLPVSPDATFDVWGWPDDRHVVAAITSGTALSIGVVDVNAPRPGSDQFPYALWLGAMPVGYDRTGRLVVDDPAYGTDSLHTVAVDGYADVDTAPYDITTGSGLAAWARRAGVRPVSTAAGTPPLSGVTRVEAVFLPR